MHFERRCVNKKSRADKFLMLFMIAKNVTYFYTPTQALAGEAPAGRQFRLGGLVEKGSVRRESGALEVRFDVTDNQQHLTVAYTGVLPDLFHDGRGVIAKGHLEPDGVFRAEEVLAKHDEKYMPPEVAASLAAQGHPVDAQKAL